jgi:hypothetical protein
MWLNYDLHCNMFLHLVLQLLFCRNPTLAKCEDETHIPKVGDLESDPGLLNV